MRGDQAADAKQSADLRTQRRPADRPGQLERVRPDAWSTRLLFDVRAKRDRLQPPRQIAEAQVPLDDADRTRPGRPVGRSNRHRQRLDESTSHRSRRRWVTNAQSITVMQVGRSVEIDARDDRLNRPSIIRVKPGDVPDAQVALTVLTEIPRHIHRPVVVKIMEPTMANTTKVQSFPSTGTPRTRDPNDFRSR